MTIAQYVDFAKRGRESEFPTFRINVSETKLYNHHISTTTIIIVIKCDQLHDRRYIQDFNWDEQGYSMISRFYDDVAQLLDDKVLNKMTAAGERMTIFDLF